LNLLLFYILAGLIVVSGLMVVTLRNVFHSALFLVLAFFTVAGIYLMLHAEFLAAVQVLIYVGAITILMLFAIMLTYQIQSKSMRQTNEQVVPAAVISILFLIIAIFSLNKTFGAVKRPVHNQGTWTASVEVADLPSNSPYWNWTAVLEDKNGKNYLAGNSFFIVHQGPAAVRGNGLAPEITSSSGYILSPYSDFSNNTKTFTHEETVNIMAWSDDLDYGKITDATWKITSSADSSKSITKPLINSNPETIGRLIMSKFVLPFEVVSVLLLVSLIGAIVIARKDS
jgi:NADH:ubiquinone oxidoreductase subunit 6 (subunit J)